MRRLIAPLIVLALAAAVPACASKSHEESNPVAPSSLALDISGESAGELRGRTDPLAERPELVALRGTIRDLNDRKTQFVLVLPQTDAQPEPRTVLVRLDDRTKIVAGDHLVRRSVLQNGLECAVDGILRADSHVLARKITLARRLDRR